MDEISVEQFLVMRSHAGTCQIVAQSTGCVDDWQPEAERICTGFGERPGGTPFGACVFAQPIAEKLVAIVHVSDAGGGAIQFHFLILPRRIYCDGIGDPFAVAKRFPTPMHTRSELPTLTWSAEPSPRRTVEQVREVLQRVNSDDGTPRSPVLLGVAQALVDGGQVVFERSNPDTDLLQDVWTLLPHSTRSRLWPASFAFSNALGFDVAVVPHAKADEFAGYLTEQQAADYPPGRYELSLQIAAEAGDQIELDRLFARRSRAQMFRLGLILLGIMVGLLVLTGLLRAVFQQ